MTVLFTDLKRTTNLYRTEYEEAVHRVMESGWYILGNELEAFETEFADYIGTRHCIGVGCGQDALILAIRALGIGPDDEVIVAGNTYIATVLGVTENGATPVFIDCDDFFEMDETLIESAITEKTKAVLLTNLYGQCCNLPAIKRICDKRGLMLVEDCAQSHGANFEGIMGGTAGIVSCFSFYPTKPLGAFGDAGAILTDDGELAERARALRNYGSKEKYVNEVCGINSRLDEIQAAVLRVGLKHLTASNKARQRIAERYLEGIDNKRVALPKLRNGADCVYHIFPVLCERRDDLKAHLISKGVQTQIHYPIPPHKAGCYAKQEFANVVLPKTEQFARQQLSLPIYCGMPAEDVDVVIAAINDFE